MSHGRILELQAPQHMVQTMLNRLWTPNSVFFFAAAFDRNQIPSGAVFADASRHAAIEMKRIALMDCIRDAKPYETLLVLCTPLIFMRRWEPFTLRTLVDEHPTCSFVIAQAVDGAVRCRTIEP